jgi:hypothetical protein
MNKTRKPDPRVKAPDLVQVQEGFSPSKKTTPQWPLSDEKLAEIIQKKRSEELQARVNKMKERYLTKQIVDVGEIVLNFKDLMMILTGAMSPFINQLNNLTKEVEELKEIIVRYADEVRKSRKKR